MRIKFVHRYVGSKLEALFKMGYITQYMEKKKKRREGGGGDQKSLICMCCT